MIFSRYISKSGIAGLCDSSTFNFLRSLHTLLQRSSTNLYSHQQGERVPFSPHPLQYLLLNGHSDQYDMMISHCSIYFHSLISSDVEHLFMCSLSICMSSSGKCLFRSSAHFVIVLFVFLNQNCMSCLYIFQFNPLLVASFANIFFHSEGCLFILFMVSFAMQNPKA